MLRRLLNLLTLLSLVVSAGLAVLWIRSYRGADRLRLDAFDGLYELRSIHGRVVLCAPQHRAGSAKAWELASRLRNDQIDWVRDGPYGYNWCGTGEIIYVDAVPRKGTPAQALQLVAATSAHRPLLRALGDPDRYVAAHALLLAANPPKTGSWPVDLTRQLGAYCDGLRVDLLDDGQRIEQGLSVRTFYSKPTSWNVEPEQMAATRALWLERFSGPIAAVPHWGLLSFAALLPLWLWYWSARSYGRAARLRASSLCPSCGYDLRATPDRCPECGATAVEFAPAQL